MYTEKNGLVIAEKQQKGHMALPCHHPSFISRIFSFFLKADERNWKYSITDQEDFS